MEVGIKGVTHPGDSLHPQIPKGFYHLFVQSLQHKVSICSDTCSVCFVDLSSCAASLSVVELLLLQVEHMKQECADKCQRLTVSITRMKHAKHCTLCTLQAAASGGFVLITKGVNCLCPFLHVAG